MNAGPGASGQSLSAPRHQPPQRTMIGSRQVREPSGFSVDDELTVIRVHLAGPLPSFGRCHPGHPHPALAVTLRVPERKEVRDLRDRPELVQWPVLGMMHHPAVLAADDGGDEGVLADTFDQN
jgi:hypothetical protein